MKIAVVYNRSSQNVINLFGMPNQEKIGLKTIARIADALKKSGHQVRVLEGGKDIVDQLEDFMPRVVKGERPGMVFNLSYGIQGQARYTHLPGILEMVGIPYVGSGPLAHSLALDKVVAKVIFRQNGIPTPDFAVLDAPGFDVPDIPFPLIVKPKNEAVSFGLKVVHNEDELRAAADVIFKKFDQPVLAEEYIPGREVNVGLLGNNPPEVLPPVELDFGKDGPAIYTYEDKTRKSGREVGWKCPAPIGDRLTQEAQDIARRAFSALGCYDCARVDMRLSEDGKLFVLEVNSMPSMGEHGSYTIGAEHGGLDYTALVNRLVEVAAARYFGTPSPPHLEVTGKELDTRVFSYLVERRDQIEKRVQEWTSMSSRTGDPIGLEEASRKLGTMYEEMRLKQVPEFSDGRHVWCWQTRTGMKDGILLIGHIDVPISSQATAPVYRREAEWLHGEGIGTSRAPLVMVNYALRALRSFRYLRQLPLGVMMYGDEGLNARYSREVIRAAAGTVKSVLVLRPGNPDNFMVNQRRGWREYRLTVEGTPRTPGRAAKRRDVFRWISDRLEEMARLSTRENRLTVATMNMRTESFPQLLPHRVIVRLVVSYGESNLADETEAEMRTILGDRGYRWKLESTADRPPMKKRKKNDRLLHALTDTATKWEIPLAAQSGLWPSVAGLVPSTASVICGVGPVARDLDTPNEAVQRISLLQRTLLLAQYLVRQTGHQQ